MKETKKPNPFLKKASGEKPPNRAALKKQQNMHGLGRGLNGLLAPTTHVAEATVPPKAVSAAVAKQAAASGIQANSNSALEIPILEIERSPYQPRRDFKEEELAELAASIRENGIIQPPTVRKNSKGRFELIAGERRLRAAQRAGLSTIKVNLVVATDEQAAAMTATENLQREDLNPIEEGESYRMLIDNFSYTQEQVAEKVGKSRPVVANAVRLLELPDEVKQLITQNLLSLGHAKVLLSLDDETERILLARDCVTDGLSVRALERKIARRHAPPAPPKVARPDLSDSYVRTLEEAIRRVLGCAVRLKSAMSHANGKRTKGLLEIDFSDNDDLDRILATLGVKVD